MVFTLKRVSVYLLLVDFNIFYFPSARYDPKNKDCLNIFPPNILLLHLNSL